MNSLLEKVFIRTNANLLQYSCLDVIHLSTEGQAAELHCACAEGVIVQGIGPSLEGSRALETQLWKLKLV